jgi:hypothetical protein
MQERQRIVVVIASGLGLALMAATVNRFSPPMTVAGSPTRRTVA